MKKILPVLFILSIFFLDANSQTMNVSYKTITQTNPSMHYTIDATYPQVDFGPEALMGVRGIAQDINNTIDTTVYGIIQSFINEVSQMPEKTINGQGSSLSFTSSAWINNGILFSSEMTVFENVAGMAHPLTTIRTINVTDDGEGQLTLSSLYKPDADYLTFISNYCINYLKSFADKEGYTNINDMITSGAAPDVKNFTEWSIKDDSLNIVFNPYQIAPYVFGIQRVPIALSSMISLLDPKGPLSYMFR